MDFYKELKRVVDAEIRRRGLKDIDALLKELEKEDESEVAKKLFKPETEETANLFIYSFPCRERLGILKHCNQTPTRWEVKRGNFFCREHFTEAVQNGI